MHPSAASLSKILAQAALVRFEVGRQRPHRTFQKGKSNARATETLSTFVVGKPEVSRQ